MTLDELLAREGIRDTVVRYNSYSDTGRFEPLWELFAEDAVMELDGADGETTVYDGREEIKRIFTGAQERVQERIGTAGPTYIRHFTATHQIDLVDADHATGRCYFAVIIDDGPRPLGPLRRSSTCASTTGGGSPTDGCTSTASSEPAGSRGDADGHPRRARIRLISDAPSTSGTGTASSAPAGARSVGSWRATTAATKEAIAERMNATWNARRVGKASPPTATVMEPRIAATAALLTEAPVARASVPMAFADAVSESGTWAMIADGIAP